MPSGCFELTFEVALLETPSVECLEESLFRAARSQPVERNVGRDRVCPRRDLTATLEPLLRDGHDDTFEGHLDEVFEIGRLVLQNPM